MRQKEKLNLAFDALRVISNLSGDHCSAAYAKQVVEKINASDNRRVLRPGSVWRDKSNNILTIHHVDYAAGNVIAYSDAKIALVYTFSQWDDEMTYNDAGNPGQVSSRVTDAPTIPAYLLRVGAIWRNDSGVPHEILQVDNGWVNSREIATLARIGYCTALKVWARNMTYLATDNMPAMLMRKETSTEGTASTPAPRQPTNEQIAEMKPGTTWTHYNGKRYTIIDIANKSSRNAKYPRTVVYIGDNGEIWARPLNDWHRSMTRCYAVPRDTSLPAVGSIWRTGGGNPYIVTGSNGVFISARCFDAPSRVKPASECHKLNLIPAAWMILMRPCAPDVSSFDNGRDDTHPPKAGPRPHPLADLLPLVEAIHDKTIMPHNEELKMNLRMAAYKLSEKIRGA